MGHAQRRSVRKKAAQAIVVSNSMTGESMGRIGNLSNDGMMLIASKHIHEEYYFQISFPLTNKALQSRKLEVGVQCLWTEQSRSANSHWAGFRIIDIADTDQAFLKIWVDEQELVD
jgi:hypothetical protein